MQADTLRTSYLPHLASFLPATVTAPLELRIVKRGLLPSGGGEVVYSCPAIRTLKPGYNFITPGSVSKIRGIAHSVRVSPTFAQRLVNGAKEVLSPLCSDTRIYTDVYRGNESGKSPGFGLTLVSTSTTSALHSAEALSAPAGAGNEAEAEAQRTPEELGAQAAYELLESISTGSCVDRGMEWLACLCMALGSEDVGRVRIAGPLSPLLVQFLRDLKDFFGVTMKVRPLADLPSNADVEDTPEEAYVLSCVGIGYANIAKKT